MPVGLLLPCGILPAAALPLGFPLYWRRRRLAHHVQHWHIHARPWLWQLLLPLRRVLRAHPICPITVLGWHVLPWKQLYLSLHSLCAWHLFRRPRCQHLSHVPSLPIRCLLQRHGRQQLRILPHLCLGHLLQRLRCRHLLGLPSLSIRHLLQRLWHQLLLPVPRLPGRRLLDHPRAQQLLSVSRLPSWNLLDNPVPPILLWLQPVLCWHLLHGHRHP